MQTLVYLANIQPLKEESVFRRALNAVSQARREKTVRLRFADDRARSLGAELLLRKAVRDHGILTADLECRYGKNEKPYLDGYKDFCFNLSHSGDMAMCAVSGNETGCDIEKIRETDFAAARRFFCREEAEMIRAAADPEEKKELFFRIWTLKESFMKCTGLGMGLPMNGFRIDFGPDGGISVHQTVDLLEYRFTELDGIPGYRAALCLAGDICEPEIRIISLTDLPELSDPAPF